MAAIRRADLLLRDVQYQVGDIAYSATPGIRKAELVRYLNDTQTTIYNKLLNCHSSLYVRAETMGVTAGVAEYTIPSAVHSTANIVKVDYSFDSNPINYVTLDLRTPRQEISVVAFPTSYFLRNGKIVLSPIPSQTSAAALRLNYQYILPDLDIRRGLIQTHDASTISLTLNTLLLQETQDDLANGFVDYVCVVSKDGTIQARGLPVNGYNPTTRVITTALSAADIAAIVNNESFLVFGEYASTHSQLLPICERYLTNGTALLVQMRDSNSEAVATSPLLQSIENEILGSVMELEEDLTAIPILDFTMLNYDQDL